MLELDLQERKQAEDRDEREHVSVELADESSPKGSSLVSVLEPSDLMEAVFFSCLWKTLLALHTCSKM